MLNWSKRRPTDDTKEIVDIALVNFEKIHNNFKHDICHGIHELV